jgi:hypothetical protein
VIFKITGALSGFSPSCVKVRERREPETRQELAGPYRLFETASEVVQDVLQKQMEYFSRREALIADLDSGLNAASIPPSGWCFFIARSVVCIGALPI